MCTGREPEVKGMKAFKGVLLAVILAATVFAMSNGAPTLTCTQCHMGAAQHPAQFKVIGLPKEYVPGKAYKITIEITKGPDCTGGVACGGFAVSVSAGKLKVIDPKDTFISTDMMTGKPIITHTKEGSLKREWTFEWIAPKKPVPVTFNIAVIAANGDGSPMGDWYASKIITIQPAVMQTSTSTTTTAGACAPTTVTVTKTVTVTVTTTVTVTG
ncbi:hypothetical protein IPA_02670 [Ignicoccus pacificus DSM 13166]|uniref:Reelin domain-containing protein n=1 Tax=Ignicoccus pacificus DSM 13166 TaxID=940294 RepID=A0A977PKQ1_9CREN|nr:hypothetical protein IPA_02670 [Ignicoccus pacificus DSM 13166]